MSKLLAAVLAASCAAAWAGEPQTVPSGNPAMGHIDGPATDGALNRVDALHAEVKAAIAEARKAKEAVPPKASSRAELVGALRQRLVDECMKATPTTALLAPAQFNEQPQDIVAYQACASAEAKSAAPCEQLRPLAYGATGGTKAEGTPYQDCRAAAGGRAQVSALVRGGGAGACSVIAPMFDKVAADKGDATCKALLSPGEASAVCARAASAYGPGFGAEEKKDCLALMSVRGAKSPAACAALPKDLVGYCREAVAGRSGCADLQAKIVGARCAVVVRDRLAGMNAEITAQEAQMAVKAPSTTAVEAALAKRKEIDDLMLRIGASLDAYEPKSDPKYLKRRDRYTRARAGVDATLNSYFGKQQKQQKQQ